MAIGHDSPPMSSGKVIAEGSYSDGSQHESNFGQLRVTTFPGMEDRDQMRAAGFLEGFLTAGTVVLQSSSNSSEPGVHFHVLCSHPVAVHVILLSDACPMGCPPERISDHVHNVRIWFHAKGNGTEQILEGLVKQDEYVRREADRLAVEVANNVDVGGMQHSFWYAVSLVIEQLEGVRQGQRARAAEERIDSDRASVSGIEPIDKEDLLLINALGERRGNLFLLPQPRCRIGPHSLSHLCALLPHVPILHT